MSDFAEAEDEIPEMDETKMVDEIVASEPSPPPSESPNGVDPDTIEIMNKAAILPYVIPQKSKFWHFQFKDSSNQDKLTNLLKSISQTRPLTVEYGESQKSPDITLKDKTTEEIVGKIHLLLCDRRYANLPEKYYVKLYFYDFKDNQLYGEVKKGLTDFFENFKPINSSAPQLGGKKKRKHHHTMKKRRVNRKKTHKRK